MNPFLWLYEFATNRKLKLSHRAAFFVIGFFMIIAIDNIMGLSFHLKMSNRIDEIKRVDALLQNPASDSLTRQYAFKLKNDIIKRKDLLDLLLFWNAPSSQKDDPGNIGREPTKQRPMDSGINVLEGRNKFWHLLTSGFSFYLMGILLFFIIIIDKKSSYDTIATKLGTAILIFVSMFFFGYMLSFVFGFIPILFNSWIYNYILNFVLQSAVIALSFYYSMKMDKRNKNLRSNF
jgi:hypothetical protein